MKNNREKPMKPKFDSLKRSTRFTNLYIDWLRKKIQITNIRNQAGHYGWLNRNKKAVKECYEHLYANKLDNLNEIWTSLKTENWTMVNRKYE